VHALDPTPCDFQNHTSTPLSHEAELTATAGSSKFRLKIDANLASEQGRIPVNWRWNVRRAVISAFVLFHVTGVSVWLMPASKLKDLCVIPYRYYMLPLGMWQWWAIFAPDPIRNTTVLEAEVVDAKGIRQIYEYTRLADLSWWQKIPYYRHPKFTGNMTSEEYASHRLFTARHAVRKLDISPDKYPLVVSLYCQVKDSPPFGTALADEMKPARVHMLERFTFNTMKEVRP
jgi:hypothetical protein